MEEEKDESDSGSERREEDRGRPKRGEGYGSSSSSVPRDGPAGVKAAWRAEAERQTGLRLERLRKVWLIVVAAAVLLPPLVVGVLLGAGAVVYVCMRTMRAR